MGGNTGKAQRQGGQAWSTGTGTPIDLVRQPGQAARTESAGGGDCVQRQARAQFQVVRISRWSLALVLLLALAMVYFPLSRGAGARCPLG